ncbi:MAG: phosphoribosylaminoimidazolesuccinocarboxamide synthase [Candidatus Sumerlaeaceae bacterium]
MTVYQSELSLPLIWGGKVREVYGVDSERLLLVASDRLSAFDVVFPDPIPRKGEVLNQLSAYWFEQTKQITPNHVISAEPEKGLAELADVLELRGRAMLVRRTQPLPVECVVRGYLEGSAWKDYQRSRMVSGIPLPSGLRLHEKLPHPIFTPSTKAEAGHDAPISFEEVVELIGLHAAEHVRHVSVQLYKFAYEQLLPKGIVLCDTKFEFGVLGNDILLIDEALTPDSSRFCEVDGYEPGGIARSLDKQYVRDYLETTDWDKQPPGPGLPPEVIEQMTRRYVEIYERITDQPLV